MKLDKVHFLLIVITCFPLFWAIETYVQNAGAQDSEVIAAAVTIVFYLLVFLGRSFIKILAVSTSVIPLKLYPILGVFMGIFTLWLFIYPNFNTLHGFPVLRLLAYWLPFIGLSLSLGMFIKLVRINVQRLEEAQVNVTHSQSELKLLQSQISPHFLFNTLNNLYGISLNKHEQIPPLLLKLSELLRYSVYDAKELFVPLKEEIAYINNYIDFEKIRIGDRLKITSKIEEAAEDLKIAPMILIIFIENAFKHAKNSTDDNIHVDIELKIWANSILFSVKNSYQVNEVNGITGKYSGFGHENVKKRLELLYPAKHDLKIDAKEDLYEVMLQLKIK